MVQAGALESELRNGEDLTAHFGLDEVQAWTEWCKNTEQSVGIEARILTRALPTPALLGRIFKNRNHAVERMLSGHSAIATSGEAAGDQPSVNTSCRGNPSNNCHPGPKADSPKRTNFRSVFQRTAQSMVPDAAKAPASFTNNR